MARGNDQNQNRDKQELERLRRENERYRQATEDALQQLDWCIGYLHGLRKLDVSRVLAKNRGYIRGVLLDREEQPLPAQQTEES